MLANLRPYWIAHTVLTFPNAVGDFFVGGSVERRLSRQKDEENDPDGPNIATLVVFLFEHFRRDVI